MVASNLYTLEGRPFIDNGDPLLASLNEQIRTEDRVARRRVVEAYLNMYEANPEFFDGINT